MFGPQHGTKSPIAAAVISALDTYSSIPTKKRTADDIKNIGDLRDILKRIADDLGDYTPPPAYPGIMRIPPPGGIGSGDPS